MRDNVYACKLGSAPPSNLSGLGMTFAQGTQSHFSHSFTSASKTVKSIGVCVCLGHGRAEIGAEYMGRMDSRKKAQSIHNIAINCIVLKRPLFTFKITEQFCNRTEE